ncbi:MAG: hypothetical protein ACXAC7_00560 [Candidatus Hodarchaeales archaeon]|jgi:hypothetical protein
MLNDKMNSAYKDIQACLQIWTELLLNKFPDDIECIYSKGSAIKPWVTKIDYVPILSDVDIHVKFSHSREDIFQILTIDEAIEITALYEEKFYSNVTKPIHLPRVQLNNVNRLIKDPDFTPPRNKDVKILFGDLKFNEIFSDDQVRNLDKKHLLTDLNEFLPQLPEKIFDRAGLDFWNLVRRLTWRVSPTPVRLLTQLLDDSAYDIWSWNRTTIKDKLIDQELNSLAEAYQEYYQTGWNLLISNFTETQFYRNLIKHGYDVLSISLNIVKNL